jgi:endonuclease III
MTRNKARKRGGRSSAASGQSAGAERRLPSRTALRRRAHRAATILHATYGSPRHGNKEDPLDELVFILLSQMTTGPSFNRVYDRMKAAYPTWAALLELSLPKVKVAIKDAGV